MGGYFSGGSIIPGVDNPFQSGNSTISQGANAVGINPQGINAQNTIGTITDPILASGNAISRMTGGSGNVLNDVGIGGVLGNTANMTYSGLADSALIAGAVVGGAYLGGADFSGTSMDMSNAGDTMGQYYDSGQYTAQMGNTTAFDGGYSGSSMASMAGTPGTSWSGVAGKTLGTMGNMATLGAGLKLVGGLYGLYKSSQNPNTSNTPSPAVTTASNANATASATAATQLTTALNDPSSYYDSASYQAGLQALERTDAAQGYAGSGKMLADLQNYGQTSYQSYITNLSQIANMSLGASTGAVNAGTNVSQASNQNNSLNLQSQINALNLIGGTLGQWGSNNSNNTVANSAGF
jgi:hypothetical protein